MRPPKEIKLTWTQSKKQFRKMIGHTQFWLGADRAKSQRLAWDIQEIWDDRQAHGGVTWTQDDLMHIACMREIIYNEEASWQAIEAMRAFFAPAGQPLPPPMIAPGASHAQAAPQENATLYQAITAYQELINASEAKSQKWKAVAIPQAEAIKKACKDRSLSEFGYDAIVGIHDGWVGRIKRNDLSPRTGQNLLASLRAFINWLDNTNQFTWTMPKGVLRVLKVPPSLRRSLDPKTLSVEQLGALWKACMDDRQSLKRGSGLKINN
jgi:hypothetical protein